MKINKFDTEIYIPSFVKNVFTMLVTDIHHYETVDNESHALNSMKFEPYEDRKKTGDDIEFLGSSGYNLRHLKAVKGIRTDFSGGAVSNVLMPVKHSGHVPYAAVGDYAVIEKIDGTSRPLYKGAIHSKNTNWADSIKRFERPVPPSLEMRGSTGEVMTYNPVYITFHENYKPTERYFGTKEEKIWYDRFVLFESSDVYRNKKNFIDYNIWIKDTFESKGDGSENILKLLEDPNILTYMDRFFYLKEGKYPFRPDPVFDTYSPLHQQKNTDSIIAEKEGVNFNFGKIEIKDLDNYPVTYKHLNLSEKKLQRTAFDEVINTKLREIREKAKLRNEDFLKKSLQVVENDGFTPDLKNKDVPFEAKESREIRIGRNKLVLADIYGDDKKLFTTLKTSKDQGLTIFYDEDKFEMSQVRLRGNIGESLLLESKSDEFSRIVNKGFSGQINEMFDNKEEQNYLYMLTSNSDQMSQSWGLSRASYLMVANRDVIKGNRINNNTAVNHYNSRAGKPGRYTISGAYDTVHHVYNALLLDSSLQAYTENWTQYSPSTWVHDIRRGLSGDAQGFHRAQMGGSYVQQTYSAAKKRWQLHNDLQTNIEIDKLDIKSKTGNGGTNYMYAMGGKIDIRGDSSAKIQSGKGHVSAIGPAVAIAGEFGPPIAKDGDLVYMGGVIAMTAWGPAPLMGYGVIIAPCEPVIACGSAPVANLEPEFNLEGGGV